jgi:hypothetical protein
MFSFLYNYNLMLVDDKEEDVFSTLLREYEEMWHWCYWSFATPTTEIVTLGIVTNKLHITMFVDAQGMIQVAQSRKLGPSHHIYNMFHKRLKMLRRQHREMMVKICWVLGHKSIEGNEIADEQVKWAAKGDVSQVGKIPASLHCTLPHSKSVIKKAYWEKLKKQTISVWRKSPRYNCIQAIDDNFTSAMYCKLTDTLPKKHTAILTQLHTGHIGLNQHLYRVKQVDTPQCPCSWCHDKMVAHFLMSMQDTNSR